jgi:probable rRNA maturation factor
MARKPTGPAPKRPAQAVYKVTVQIDEDYAGEVPARLLRDAARAALKHQSAGAGALTLSLTSDEALRALNHKYLDRDYAADVLSFPSDTDDPDAGGRYFGDIAISFSRALAQAQAGGHTLEDELQLLTVHGVLHLLGHDHDQAVKKSHMWQAQAQILAGLGSMISGPTDE